MTDGDGRFLLAAAHDQAAVLSGQAGAARLLGAGGGAGKRKKARRTARLPLRAGAFLRLPALSC